jgi:hypothetical protein
MKVLDGEATLKNSRGSFARISFSGLGNLDALTFLMPPSRPYCDGPRPDRLRIGPVKMGAREASSFWSLELSNFNKLRWYVNSGSMCMFSICCTKFVLERGGMRG